MHDLFGELYLACFAIGLLSTVGLAAVGPALSGHAAHSPHGGHRGHGGKLPLLNLSTLLAFLLCGGAAGYAAHALTAGRLLVSAPVAIGGGALGAWPIVWLLRLLTRAEQGTLGPIDPVGTIGKVLARMGGDRTGEIAYLRDGQVKALPARSDDPLVDLERDTEVVVMRVEAGIAYVKPSSELFAAGRKGDRDVR